MGIICACMPSAAKTCNHHLSSFDVVKIRLLSYRGSKNSKPSLSEAGHEAATDRANGSPPQYSKFQLHQAPYSSFGSTGSLRPDIQSEAPVDMESDGIHLTFEMQSVSQ